MASIRSASATSYRPHQLGSVGSDGPFGPDDPFGSPDPFASDVRLGTDPGSRPDDHPSGEWNPSADTLRPVRGRHRVAKQRSGMARSSAVLGVGMVAAIGAGGMATAKEQGTTAVSVPDLASAADAVLSLSSHLPVVEDLTGDSTPDTPDTADTPAAQPLTQAGLTQADRDSGRTDAGEALRARILAQADQQREVAEQAQHAAATQKAVEEAAHQAAEKAAETEAKRKAAEAEAKRKAAEAKRLAELARSYVLPVSSYQLTSGFGAAGSMWANDHTGQDFAAPSGTPVKAVHSGTITEAGWAGSYGYRIVLQLEDGTEVWYCHLSSMVRTSGDVTTGDVIGRVGSTGNSTGPHLHMEVRLGGGDPIDPLTWLRDHGVGV